MYPVTASEFDFWVARVAGMPYRDCKHAGVMTLLHEEGTARVVRLPVEFAAELGRRGEVMIGPKWMSGKLHFIESGKRKNVSREMTYVTVGWTRSKCP